MENSPYTTSPRLRLMLPYYFKKIGVAIILVTGLILVMLKIMGYQFNAERHISYKLISQAIFFFGAFIIALSHDKFETERSNRIRLQSLAISVLFGIMDTFFAPFISLVIDDPLEMPTAPDLLVQMVFIYILIYFWSKPRPKKAQP